ncbi:MAG: hypothetical protein ACPGUY_08545, partial [Akkermansiaceae bacterium]
PGTSVSELTIDGELIDKRKEVLAKYRELGNRVNVAKAREEVDLFCQEFQKLHGIVLEIEDGAVSLLAEKAENQGRSVLQVCQQKFKDYQFGLKLIQRNTSKGTFTLDASAVNDADKFLSDSVVQSYTDAAEAKGEQ